MSFVSSCTRSMGKGGCDNGLAAMDKIFIRLSHAVMLISSIPPHSLHRPMICQLSSSLIQTLTLRRFRPPFPPHGFPPGNWDSDPMIRFFYPPEPSSRKPDSAMVLSVLAYVFSLSYPTLFRSFCFISVSFLPFGQKNGHPIALGYPYPCLFLIVFRLFC